MIEPKIDRPNFAKRLYNEYLDSDLVQSSEDVLSLRDISRIAKEEGVAWWNVRDEDEVHDRFWEAVESFHWDGI